MTRAQTIALLALGATGLLACTRHNPAYRHVVDRGDADLAPDPLPDALAPDVRSPLLDAGARLDLASGPPDVEPLAPDSAPPRDLAPPPDLAARDLAPDALLPAGCGTATVDVSGINNADGIAIDDDGTIYVLTDDSTHSYIGRIRPGQPFDRNWRRIDNEPLTWGIALDRKNRRVYVLVVGPPGALVVFDDIDGAAPGRKAAINLESPNDAVVAADGSVYFSNQGDRCIYRVDVNGVKGLVSTAPFGDTGQMPSAVTMDPAGNLIVGLEPSGPLYRVSLSGGTQTSRTTIPGWNGWANGLTYDRSGRLYVGIYHDTQPRTIIRLEPDGRTTTIATNGRFSSIAFGRGPLDCHDLYVTDPYAPMRRVRVPDAF